VSAQTTVGIVEWGHRARGMAHTHRVVADALGRLVGGEHDVGLQRALLDGARRHGWCADQWASVVPVLHDVDLRVGTTDPSLADALVGLQAAPDGTAARAAMSAVDERVASLLGSWTDESAPVADEPYQVVAERVVHELRG